MKFDIKPHSQANIFLEYNNIKIVETKLTLKSTKPHALPIIGAKVTAFRYVAGSTAILLDENILIP